MPFDQACSPELQLIVLSPGAGYPQPRQVGLPRTGRAAHSGSMLKASQFEHGAARRDHAAAVLGRYAVESALRDGALAQPWRGVVVDARRALDPTTRAAAARLVCGPDAVLARQTAAALHGCTAAATRDVHVLLPYSKWARSKPGLIVHHDRFSLCDVVVLHGLPVTALDLTIAELLCTERRWVALASLDQVLLGRSDRDAAEFVADVDVRLAARDDRRGVRIADALLALWTTGAESPQESRLRLLVVDAGFPIPVVQHPIVTLSGKVLYRLDLAWPELRICVEYDGHDAHEERQEYDAERDRRLAARGWRVIRVRKGDLADPTRLIHELTQAFAASRTLFAA